MKKTFAIIIILIGLALMICFGYVFIIFSYPKNPLILPIFARTILYSIILVGLGSIIFVIGIIFILKTITKQAS